MSACVFGDITLVQGSYRALSVARGSYMYSASNLKSGFFETTV